MHQYRRAFSRNIGWVSEAEQASLRSKRIAIAGLGGVGGAHLLTLTRLGVGAFHIADPDLFEPHNTNRQAGATTQSYNRPKSQVLTDLARDINPELDIRPWNERINASNAEAFLAGCDLFIDGIDFFNIKDRRDVFAAAYRTGVPAITAGPLGMGSAMLIFMPGRMSFEQYFRMEGHPVKEQQLRFLIGLAPSRLQARYIIDRTRLNFDTHDAPSTIMGCDLAAGLAATHALKILLNRGPVPVAPRGVHFDAYTNRLRRTWRPWGNRNPLQQLALLVARRILGIRNDTTAAEQPVSTGRPAAHG